MHPGGCAVSGKSVCGKRDQDGGGPVRTRGERYAGVSSDGTPSGVLFGSHGVPGSHLPSVGSPGVNMTRPLCGLLCAESRMVAAVSLDLRLTSPRWQVHRPILVSRFCAMTTARAGFSVQSFGLRNTLRGASLECCEIPGSHLPSVVSPGVNITRPLRGLLRAGSHMVAAVSPDLRLTSPRWQVHRPILVPRFCAMTTAPRSPPRWVSPGRSLLVRFMPGFCVHTVLPLPTYVRIGPAGRIAFPIIRPTGGPPICRDAPQVHPRFARRGAVGRMHLGCIPTCRWLSCLFAR